MLNELRRLHEELLQALGAMSEAVAASHHCRATVAAARLKLTQANARRRRLLQHKVLPALDAMGNQHALDVVRRLKADEVEMMRRSSTHIARWTLDTIGADWAGYRRAGTAIRDGIRDRVLLEKALLYPLLETDQINAATWRAPTSQRLVGEATRLV